LVGVGEQGLGVLTAAEEFLVDFDVDRRDAVAAAAAAVVVVLLIVLLLLWAL